MSRFREYVPSVRAALRPGILGELHAARALGVGIPELRPAREAHLDLLPSLTSLDGGLVLDVGANVGDWTAALLRVVPGARVIAIEPGDEPRAEIERRFGRDARVTIDRRAVSSSAGTRDFHLTEATLNASFHRPRAETAALYRSGWDVKDTVTVETTTIDAITAGEPVALMKVDVQGAERDVIAGARETLVRTACVLIEVNFVHHYDGDATFPEVHELMSVTGFELVGIEPAPFKSLRGTILWADACYVRADSTSPSLAA